MVESRKTKVARLAILVVAFAIGVDTGYWVVATKVAGV